VRLLKDKVEQSSIEGVYVEEEEVGGELKETGERNQILFNLMPDPVVIVDSKGRFLAVNDRVEEKTGFKREELLGKNFLRTKIVTAKSKLILIKNLTKRMAGMHPAPYEIEALTKDGGKIPAEVNAVKIEYEGKPADLLILRDITERKTAEQALKESEEKFRNLAEQSPSMIFINKKGKVVYANKKCEEIMGYKKEEFYSPDFNFFALIAPEFMDLLNSNFSRHLKGEEVAPLEYALITKEGKRIEAILTTKLIRYGGETAILGTVTDITEYKKMKELYRNVVELAPDSIITVDLKGAITSCNAAAIRMLGYSKGEMVGKHFSKIGAIEVRDLPKYLKLFSSVLRGKVTKPLELTFRRKDGTPILAEVRVGLLKEGNKTVGVQAISRDITERKKVEKERKHLEERLSAMHTYAQSLNRAKAMKEIYELTLDTAEKTLGFEFADILIIEGKMLCLATHRGPSKNLSLKLPLDGDKGITVRTAKTGKPVLVPDISKEKAYVEAGEEMRSELAVPIKVGNKVLGVLNVESKKFAAFDDDDKKLLEILASHAAIAIMDLKRHKQLREISEKLANLMKRSTEIMRVEDTHQRLNVIAKALKKFDWRRVVISLRDENLEGTELVTSGLTKEENKLLLERKAPGHVWRERLGPKFERFKIGEFYYLPWSDPWIREYVHRVPPEAPLEEATTYAGVPSRLSPEEMVDWHPQDMLYAPLRTPEGRIVGILSMDDPVDGRRPTKETLAPLELFLHQAAMVIENAQLIKNLRKARKQLEAHAEQLERRVKERTKELRESEAKFRDLIENVDDIVYTLDVNGIITSANPAIKKVLGYSADELKGRNFAEIIPKKYLKQTLRDFKTLLEKGTITAETVLLDKQGREHWVEYNSTTIVEDGKVVGTRGIVRDQTERKKMEEKLLKSERLAAIGELATMVGHDLRNPLQSIENATYYLNNELSRLSPSTPIPQKAIEMIQVLKNSVDYADKIIRDLQDFSATKKPMLKKTNINATVKEILSQVEAPENVGLITELGHLPRVEADKDQIKRTFLNLVANGIQAMENGGRLKISTKKTKGFVEVSFKDTGTGISKENMEKIFTPFFTTRAKGMGMGLSICKKIVDAHDGSIEVESEVGKGSTFTVKLPIQQNNGGENY